MRNLPVFFLSALLGVGIAASAFAQDADTAGGNHSDWKYQVGAGAMTAPNYEGSKHYVLKPLPLVELSWRDAVSVGTKDGLKVVIKPLADKGFSVSGGLGYWMGRKEGVDKNHGDTLRGLGSLSANAVGKLGVAYRYQALNIGADMARDIGGDRDGTSVTLKGGYQIFRSARFRLNGETSTTWVDDNYMSNMFGVSQAQANNSLMHYSPYSAGSGIKDVKLGFTGNYEITPSVSLFGVVAASRLLNDAADNPIVRTQGSANQFEAGLGLMYHF
jgi:outer membrane scaffolding protein for murein synthesis (MipA/OmpV family)